MQRNKERNAARKAQRNFGKKFTINKITKGC